MWKREDKGIFEFSMENVFCSIFGQRINKFSDERGTRFWLFIIRKEVFFFLIDVLLFFAAYAVTNTDDRKSVNIITLK